MPDDLSDLMQRIHALPNRSLIHLLEHERDQYTSEAISVAEEEVQTRGGLPYLKQESSLVLPENPDPERGKQGQQRTEHLLSRLIGRAPSEQYPARSPGGSRLLGRWRQR